MFTIWLNKNGNEGVKKVDWIQLIRVVQMVDYM